MTEILAQPIVCPLLIGRDAQVEALCRLIDRVGYTGAQVAFIAGEAGVGKSRLVAEAKAYAAARDIRALQGNCYPEDQAAPYAPLLDILRARFAGQPPEAIAAAFEPFARDLSPLLPDLLAAREVAHLETAGLMLRDPDQERQRLFAALAHAIARPGAHQPVVLIVEDLHWCDQSSLDVLLYLLRRAAGLPLLLIGTYRSDEIDPPLRTWLTRLDRERLTQELCLPLLSREEVAAMLEAIFGVGCPVRDAFLDPINMLAEGNPFYVEELLKSLVAAGGIVSMGAAWEYEPAAELRIPRSLHDAVQQRAARLSPEAHQVLMLAAVVGRRFTFELLHQLVPIDEHELLRLLRELIAAQLVLEESANQLAFRHALTQQAIYTDLLARERMSLHRAVAEMIEQRYVGSLDSHADDLAAHFHVAEVWDKALMYARRAGERAQRLYAPHAVVEQFTRALIAAQKLAQNPVGEAAQQPAVAQLHRARGHAYELLGDFDYALADYEAALEQAQAEADSQAEWQALLDLGLLWAGRDYAQAGDYYGRALDLARRLDDPAMLARSLNRVGNWHVNVARPQQALQLHQEALAIFEQLRDWHGIAETYDLLGMAQYNSADLSGCVVCFEQAVARFRDLGDRQGLISSLTMLTVRGGTYAISSMQTDAECFAAALRDGELALQEARAIDWRAGEAFALFGLGWALGPRGQYGRALDLAHHGLQIAEEIGHQQWMAGAHWTLGMLHLDLLALRQARRHLEQARALAQAIGSMLWTHFAIGALALAYVLGNDLDQAETTLEDADDPAAPVQWLGQWLIAYARVRLALACGDPAQALRILDRVSPPGAGSLGARDTPRLATARGEALTALGRTVEAEAVLQAALEVTRKQGARPQRWRTLVALGNLYRAQRRHEDAQHAFAAAQGVILELAADTLDEPARNAFVRRATALLPRPFRLTPRRVTAAQFGGLTAREREVAALVAQGHSNRDIAEALVIGERTAEAHVGHILAKLEFSSREQIAAWAIDKGLIRDT